MKLRLPLTLILPVFLATGTLPAQAQNATIIPAVVTVNESAEERINNSGKLRMLSQRVASAACHLSSGVDVDGATALLNGAIVEFDRILAALEFGDPQMNIQGAETRRKTIAGIHAVRDLWAPLEAAADAIVAGNAANADLDYILEQNMAVLAAAQLLVEELTDQYVNPNAATRATLMSIDIAGRQRMLTQKMSKETCIIASGDETLETRAELERTVQIFEASLQALRFGMPEVGIQPPPNETIYEGLSSVLNNWTDVKTYMDEVVAGGELDDVAQAQKFQALNQTMTDMNVVVGLYTQAARSD